MCVLQQQNKHFLLYHYESLNTTVKAFFYALPYFVADIMTGFSNAII